VILVHLLTAGRAWWLVVVWLVVLCGRLVWILDVGNWVYVTFLKPTQKAPPCFLSRWLLFMGQNGLSGGFIRPNQAATKKGQKEAHPIFWAPKLNGCGVR
jgi:hypothetical protein